MKKLMLLSIALVLSVGVAFAKDKNPLEGKIQITNDTSKKYDILVTYKKNNAPEDQRYTVDKKSYITLTFKDDFKKDITQLDRVESNKDKVIDSIRTIKEKDVYVINENGFSKK